MYHPSYTLLKKYIQTYVKPNPVIVDYGCGNGVLIDLLGAKRIKKYVGFEVSDSALRVAQERELPRSSFAFHKIHASSLPTFGKPKSVDLVILIGVLQYLDQKEINHVLRESLRVLKPGGHIIASCVTDHAIYRLLNLYRFILPNHYIHRDSLLSQARKLGFIPVINSERGLIIGPLFSHGIVILFDAVDKLIFRNKGKLGPIGVFMRKLLQPVMFWELLIPIDFGYTLYLVLQKPKNK